MKYHNCYEDDCGFFSFYDQYRHRHIFVTSKEIGGSRLFHVEYDIQSIWNVINPCSNHEHSSDMTPHRKKWFVTNILRVCLQMFDTEGNIAIFCNTGRSRSPMYLVTYIMLFCDKTIDRAMFNVEELLSASRANQELDRHCTLYEIISSIADEFNLL